MEIPENMYLQTEEIMISTEKMMAFTEELWNQETALMALIEKISSPLPFSSTVKDWENFLMMMEKFGYASEQFYDAACKFSLDIEKFADTIQNAAMPDDLNIIT